MSRRRLLGTLVFLLLATRFEAASDHANASRAEAEHVGKIQMPESFLPVIYDQRNSPSSAGRASVDFQPANDSFDSQSADDFVVPAGQTWKVTGVLVPGFYSGGSPPAQSINVFVYQDAAGLPGAAQCSYSGLTSYSEQTGAYTISLPGSCTLSPGRYWLSVQANMNFPNTWYWQERTVQTGNPFAWINPGNGYATGCTAWTAGTSCGAPNPDLNFALQGLTNACSSIVIQPSSPLPDATAGVAYARTISASGGTPPYSYQASGPLPRGLTLDSATGSLSGTPTIPATYTFDVVVTDAGGCAGAQTYVLTVLSCRIAVSVARVTDRGGDQDGIADTNETVDLLLTVSNKTGRDLTSVVARLATTDPKIDCVSIAAVSLGSLPAHATQTLPAPFRFKVSATADRAGATPPVACAGSLCSNGAGACTVPANCVRTPGDEYAANFTFSLTSDQCGAGNPAEDLAMDLDLNAPNSLVNTTTFTEGFESTFGNFTFMNLDFNVASNSAANGMRCPYSDPDSGNSNAPGEAFCYPGTFPAASQSPINGWHVHTTTSPDGGRGFVGNQSLHYGVHTPGNPNLDTYQLSQLDALRTKSTINLAARVCAQPQGGAVKSCNSAADCTTPASACVSASPELSFKQQVSTVDSRSFTSPPGMAADRALVEVQVGTTSVWQRVDPSKNVYDVQADDSLANCTFDPTDDGNNEDSFFDPTDPQRRLGPSSSCYPRFAFSYQGDTDGPFNAASVGRASDGPGLQGSVGPGTWVETRFDLSRYRGRTIRLRYLFTSMKVLDTFTVQSQRAWNPVPDDDGWYIDDVRLTQSLGTSSPTVTTDAADNTGLPACGACLGDGDPCDDGNLCTSGDACAGGGCTAGSSVVCSASDACHLAGTCNPASGLCSNPAAPNGTACDDGNGCTTGDACSAGSCGGTPVAPPAEVGQGLRVARSGTDSIVTWNPAAGATSSDVLRGDLASLPVGPGGGDEVCLGTTAGASMIDLAVPPAHAGVWYLVRGKNACAGAGPYGTQGVHGAPGAPRVSTTCPP